MSYTFQVTLAGLNADATAITGFDADKVDLGQLTIGELQAVAEKFRQLDPVECRNADAGIVVRRGDKGWRISNQPGQLRVHHSTSSFDDFWVAESAASLAELPPFRAASTAAWAAAQSGFGSTRRGGPMRTALEIGGLITLALVCMAVALFYGTPRRKLSDPPDSVVVIRSADESREIFARVAGSYATGTKKGNSIVTITADGRVSLAMVGPDGKPAAPARIANEQARAGRKGNLPCVLTSFGVIVIAPPEGVDVGTYRWKRAAPL